MVPSVSLVGRQNYRYLPVNDDRRLCSFLSRRTLSLLLHLLKFVVVVECVCFEYTVAVISVYTVLWPQEGVWTRGEQEHV